jgi:hypothetical protein
MCAPRPAPPRAPPRTPRRRVCPRSQTSYKSLSISSKDVADDNPLKIGEEGGVALQVTNAPSKYTLSLTHQDDGKKADEATSTNFSDLVQKLDLGDGNSIPLQTAAPPPISAAFEEKKEDLKGLEQAAQDAVDAAEPPAAFVSSKPLPARPAAAKVSSTGAGGKRKSAKAGVAALAGEQKKAAAQQPKAAAQQPKAAAQQPKAQPQWGRMHHPEYNKRTNHETLLRKEPIDTNDGSNFYKSYVEEGDAVTVHAFATSEE